MWNPICVLTGRWISNKNTANDSFCQSTENSGLFLFSRAKGSVSRDVDCLPKTGFCPNVQRCFRRAGSRLSENINVTNFRLDRGPFFSSSLTGIASMAIAPAGSSLMFNRRRTKHEWTACCA